MPELTKKDIKEIFVETLEPFAKAVQDDFGAIKKELKENHSELKGEIGVVKSDLAEVKFELAEVKSDVKWIKDNSSELFTKLDKFIALYEKQEHELLIFGEQLKRLEERVAKVEAEHRRT